MLCKGGQGRTSARIESDAVSFGYVILALAIVFFIACFTGGCACSTPERRLQKTFENQ